jgi:hypothetical protein
MPSGMKVALTWMPLVSEAYSSRHSGRVVMACSSTASSRMRSHHKGEAALASIAIGHSRRCISVFLCCSMVCSRVPISFSQEPSSATDVHGFTRIKHRADKPLLICGHTLSYTDNP